MPVTYSYKVGKKTFKTKQGAMNYARKNKYKRILEIEQEYYYSSKRKSPMKKLFGFLSR